jgi:hypothetical protein
MVVWPHLLVRVPRPLRDAAAGITPAAAIADRWARPRIF